jgi:CubicO group peptidase (beta-lactamase class C family)
VIDRGQSEGGAVAADSGLNHMRPGGPICVQGQVTDGFGRVRDAFAANFSRDSRFADLGAALSVYVAGVRVVHLLGGYRDAQVSRPWTESTLVNVWSASKGVIAVAIAQLVDSGRLAYEQPVADLWPEFAAAGKARITVAQVLSHQSGLNGFAEPTAPEDLFDWDLITSRLARQRPFWEPGTLTSYHARTFGWLGGEIVRRVTGMPVRDYVRTRIADPLAADLAVGCPVARQEDVAQIIGPARDRNPELNAVAQRAVVNPVPDANLANTDAWRAAEIPAINVHCSADGLARIYAALANRGSLNGVRILSQAGVDALRRERSPGPDEMLGPRRWAAGVALNPDAAFGPDPEAFGHAGWGGSFGCASVEANVAMAYVVNRMGSKLNGDPRARSICAAVFECMG